MFAQTEKMAIVAETVLPLGRLGGRLGRQISEAGKFFEKKNKNRRFFFSTSRKRN
jgi:hypothetical protein